MRFPNAFLAVLLLAPLAAVHAADVAGEAFCETLA